MIKALARITLLMLLPLALFSKYIIDDNIISPKAKDLIEKIGLEAKEKTDINLYVITTTEKIGKGVNLYKYIERYSDKLERPYIILFFAPNSKRIGILNSNQKFKTLYDRDNVLDYAIKIIEVPDKNSLQSKYDVGIVQAYSELADEVASKKGVILKSTIKNESSWLITLITWLVYLGTVLVFWVYFFRPIFRRLFNVK
jgi:hypothetical protein